MSGSLLAEQAPHGAAFCLDLGHAGDPALPAPALLDEHMVPGRFAPHDLPGPGQAETLGHAAMGPHLRHRSLSPSRRLLSPPSLQLQPRRSPTRWPPPVGPPLTHGPEGAAEARRP